MGYKVTISDHRMIPGIGKGPIKKPITITEKKLDTLKTLGFTVTIVERNQPQPQKIEIPKVNKIEEETSQEEVTSVNDEVLTDESADELNYSEEENLSEEITEDEEVEEEITQEEDIVETEENEVVETEEEEIIDEEEEIDIDSLTKAQLKEKLDEFGVEYPSNANATKLRTILLDYLNSIEE